MAIFFGAFMSSNDDLLKYALIILAADTLELNAQGTSQAKASEPEPVGTKPLWKHSKPTPWQLPPYIQHVANALLKTHGESQAIQMAVGIVKRWASGGSKVDADTRAAASKAVAEWEDLKARANASHVKATASDLEAILLSAGAKPLTATKAVMLQMEKDYPPEATKWMGNYQWDWPHAIPLSHIDFSNKASWAAQANDTKITIFKKKITQGTLKPAILVKIPSNPNYIVVDGHHRALTCLELNRPLLAWTTTVDKNNGPWMTMHSSQKDGSSIKASNILSLVR